MDSASHPVSSFDQDGFIEDTPSDITVQAVVPPYWQHRRYESYASVNVTRPPPITLEDHTQDLPECKSPLWAKGVLVNGYVMISGGIPSVGDYIVWNCTIDTLDGGSIMMRKRYSEFQDLRHKLLMTFPTAGQALPLLPPKSLIHRFRPIFLENRRTGLEYFLNCVMLNPGFSSSPVLKEFLFS